MTRATGVPIVLRSFVPPRVVLGRYAAVAVMGALGIAMGALVQLLAATVGALGILPSEIGDMFVMSPDDVLASIFVVFLCLLMGMTAASLAIPFYFKLGNTKRRSSCRWR